MFVRLTTFNIPAEKQSEVKSMYYTEVAPIIQQQPGLVEVKLFEPLEGAEDFISCTIWKSEEDTRTFEASAAYPSVFGKIKTATSTAPSQKYFNLNH